MVCTRIQLNHSSVTLSRLVAAGVPFSEAHWYHLHGRCLDAPSVAEQRRIDTVHWMINRFGS